MRITPVERRRWRAAEKLRLVAAMRALGMSVARWRASIALSESLLYILVE